MPGGGVLWTAWQRYHGKPDSDVVLVQAATLALNPTFDRRAVDRAYEEDPTSAAAEYGGEFRGDVETFIDVQVIAACVVPGRREVPPVAGERYVAFVDPSGGSADAFTLAIAHRGLRDDEPIVVIGAVREVRPPFSPESTVTDYVALLKQYGIVVVEGDRYAGEWPREQFLKRDVSYWPAAWPKSDLYRDALPLFNSQRIELLDVPRLSAQLGALERRTARGGRDSIDHPPGAHDDLANAVCGAALFVDLQAGGVGRVVTDDGVVVHSQAEFEAKLTRRRTHPHPGDEHRPIRWGARKAIHHDVESQGGGVLVDFDPFREW